MLAAAAQQGLLRCSAGRLAGVVSLSGQLDSGLRPLAVVVSLGAQRLPSYGRLSRCGGRSWSHRSVCCARVVLVEAKGIAGATARTLDARAGADRPGSGLAPVGLFYPTTQIVNGGIFRRGLWHHGAGVGAGLAAGEFLSVYSLRFLYSARAANSAHYVCLAHV